MNKKIVGFFVMTLLIGTAVLPVLGTTNENMYNTNENIVWDNGMNYDIPGTSQWDALAGIDWFGADDFRLEDNTKVYGMRWIGAYHGAGYQDAKFYWGIQFYLDRGDNNAPGDEFSGPFTFTHNGCNPIFIEDTGSEIYYEFYVDFSDIIQFNGGQKYWCSIWGIGDFPTKAGNSAHYDPIKLHQAVCKSEYCGHPEWENVEDVNSEEVNVEGPLDYCFQLLSSLPPGVPDIQGPSSVKVGESQEYTFSSTDPDGDDVFYYINWGDESGEETIGPFQSGEEQTVSHTWDEKRIYTITVKARDIHGFESDDATLQISAPKATINTPFLTFLENHPNLFPLLRQILGL